MKYLSAFILLSLILTLSSCTVAPRPIYRAQPVDTEAPWLRGQQVASARDDRADVVAAFSHFKNGRICFDVEVVNRGDAPILVAPENFYCELTDSKESTRTLIHAIDPEQARLQSDIAAERAWARRASRESTDLLFSALTVAAEVATVNEERTEEEIQADEQADREEEMLDLQREENYQQKIKRMADSKAEWSKTALRKTTLAPMHIIGGRVSFPISSHSGRLVLVAVLEGIRYEIPFSVERIETAR